MGTKLDFSNAPIVQPAPLDFGDAPIVEPALDPLLTVPEPVSFVPDPSQDLVEQQSEQRFQRAQFIQEQTQPFIQQEQLREAMDEVRAAGPSAMDFVRSKLPFVGQATDAAFMIRARSAANRFEQGGPSDADIGILAGVLVERERREDAGFAKQVFDVVTGIPGFAIEIGATGGVFRVASKGIEKSTINALGKHAGTRIGRLATFTASRGVGAFAQTLANPQLIVASTVRQMMPELNLTEDQAGKLALVIKKNDQSFLEALPTGVLDAFIEIASERAGVRLAVGAGRLIPAKIKGAKIAILSEFLERDTGDKLKRLNQLLKKGQLGSLWGEILEEEAASLARDIAPGLEGSAAISALTEGDLAEAGRRLAVNATAFAIIPGARAAAAFLDKPNPSRAAANEAKKQAIIPESTPTDTVQDRKNAAEQLKADAEQIEQEEVATPEQELQDSIGEPVEPSVGAKLEEALGKPLSDKEETSRLQRREFEQRQQRSEGADVAKERRRTELSKNGREAEEATASLDADRLKKLAKKNHLRGFDGLAEEILDEMLFEVEGIVSENTPSEIKQLKRERLEALRTEEAKTPVQREREARAEEEALDQIEAEQAIEVTSEEELEQRLLLLKRRRSVILKEGGVKRRQAALRKHDRLIAETEQELQDAREAGPVREEGAAEEGGTERLRDLSGRVKEEEAEAEAVAEEIRGGFQREPSPESKIEEFLGRSITQQELSRKLDSQQFEEQQQSRERPEESQRRQIDELREATRQAEDATAQLDMKKLKKLAIKNYIEGREDLAEDIIEERAVELERVLEGPEGKIVTEEEQIERARSRRIRFMRKAEKKRLRSVQRRTEQEEGQAQAQEQPQTEEEAIEEEFQETEQQVEQAPAEVIEAAEQTESAVEPGVEKTPDQTLLEALARSVKEEKDPTKRGPRLRANPLLDALARGVFDEVNDELIEDGYPAVRHEPVADEASRQEILADRNGVRARLLNKTLAGEAYNEIDVVSAKTIMTDESIEALQTGDQTAVEEGQAIVSAYIVAGTEQSRAFRRRGDPFGAMDTRLIPKGPLRDFRKLQLSEAILSLNDPLAAVERLRDMGFGLENIDTIAEDTSLSMSMLAEIKAQETPFMSRLFEYWRSAGILSGPLTYAKNLGGNIIHGGWHFGLERPVEAMISQLIPQLSKRDRESTDFQELRYVYQGLIPGIGKGYRNAIASWHSENSQLQIELGLKHGARIDARGRLIRGKWGRRIRRMGYGPLLLGDELATTAIVNMQVGAEAYQIAKQKGLSGTELSQEMARQGTNYESEAWKRAYEVGLLLSFRQTRREGIRPSSQSAKASERMKDIANGINRKAPVMRFLIAFVESPVNMVETGISKSQIGGFSAAFRMYNAFRSGNLADKLEQKLLLLKKQRDAIKKGVKGKRKQDELRKNDRSIVKTEQELEDTLKTGWDGVTARMAQQVIAQGVFWSIVASLDPDDPWITGAAGAPRFDRATREQTFRTFDPLTVKLFGTRFSYAGIEPFATSMAIMVDMINATKEEGFEAKFNALGRSVLGQLDSKLFLQQYSDVIRALETPGYLKKGVRWASNFAPTFVPSLYRQGKRAGEKVYMQNKIWGDTADQFYPIVLDRSLRKAGIPLIESYPMHDLWGRLIPRHEPPWGRRDGRIIDPTGTAPLTDFLWKLFIPVKLSVDDVHPGDRIMMAYQRDHPKATKPSMPQRQITVLGEPIDLTTEQYEEFVKDAGERASDRVKGRLSTFNLEKPTDSDYKRIQDIISDTRKIARNNLIRNHSLKEEARRRKKAK